MNIHTLSYSASFFKARVKRSTVSSLPSILTVRLNRNSLEDIAEKTKNVHQQTYSLIFNIIFIFIFIIIIIYTEFSGITYSVNASYSYASSASGHKKRPPLPSLQQSYLCSPRCLQKAFADGPCTSRGQSTLSFPSSPTPYWAFSQSTTHSIFHFQPQESGLRASQWAAWTGPSYSTLHCAFSAPTCTISNICSEV